MVSASVPGFLPSVNGFHFSNSFPHEPLVGVSIPGIGPVGIGDAANGLCGGMAFAVRDLFSVSARPDATTSPPPAGSPAFDYLAGRLVDSFNLPGGPPRYLELMNPALPEHEGLTGLLGLHSRGWVTVAQEWPGIRADLDGGTLSPLGLIRVLSADPRDLGRNHQVLAWRYEVDGTQLALGVYDPNHPDDDTITLNLSTADPRAPVPIAYSAADEPVYCFFRTPYSPKRPLPWLGNGA